MIIWSYEDDDIYGVDDGGGDDVDDDDDSDDGDEHFDVIWAEFKTWSWNAHRSQQSPVQQQNVKIFFLRMMITITMMLSITIT